MLEAAMFDERAPLSPVVCKVRVPRRVYEWVGSLSDVEELRPGVWTVEEKREQCRKLRAFLRQPSTIEGDHVVVEETYASAVSSFPGRLFSSGCQGMYRPLRAHILSETADLDQSCAMQRILLWVCRTFEVWAPCLEHYIEHRDELSLIHI